MSGRRGWESGPRKSHHVSMPSQGTWRRHAFHQSHALSYPEKMTRIRAPGHVGSHPGGDLPMQTCFAVILNCKNSLSNLTVLNQSHWFLCAQMVLPAPCVLQAVGVCAVRNSKPASFQCPVLGSRDSHPPSPGDLLLWNMERGKSSLLPDTGAIWTERGHSVHEFKEAGGPLM